MSVLLSSSLRVRLALLVLMGALPLLILLIYSGFEHRAHAIKGFQQDLANLAMRTVSEQQEQVVEARQLLTVLAETPQVRHGNASSCNTLLQKLLAKAGARASLGVINAQGDVICSATSMQEPVTVVDHSYFKNALQSRSFSISEYQVAQTSREAVLVFSYPVFSDVRKITSVVFVELPLNWARDYAAESALPADSVINVIDYSARTWLAQYPGSFTQTGLPVAEGEAIDAASAALDAGMDTIEIKDVDGVDRIHFFRLLQNLPGAKQVYIGLSIPAKTVYADANAFILRNLLIFVFTIGLILLLVWNGSHAMVLQQVKSLLAVTRRMAAGDLAVRVDVSDKEDGISALGREFNQMAADLEDRAAKLKQVETSLRASEQHLRRVFETVPDIIYTATASNNFGLTFISSALARILGFQPEEFTLNPRCWIEAIHAEDRDQVRQLLSTALESGNDSFQCEYRMHHKDGKSYRWFEDRAHITRDAYGNTTVIYGVMTDITERKQAVMLSVRMGRILETSWSELYVFDATTLNYVDVSLGACRNMGYSLAELKLLTPLDLMPTISADQFEALIGPLRRGEQQVTSFEAVHRRKTGDFYPVEVRLQFSDSENPPVFIAHLQDVSERKRYIAELEHKALYDSLTNLPSRSLFLDRLKFSLSLAQRNTLSLAVLSIGVVRLREVNDTLGHGAGDIVLHEVAARLRETLRQSDTVARLGGGEFAIVLQEVSIAEATTTAKNIHELFELPMMIGDISLEIEASIGIALYPNHGDEANTLLQYADIAMQVAKNEARGFSFYKSENMPYSVRKLKLSGELRKTIEQKGLVLFYQPKIDLSSGRIVSVEALARWPHPVEGMVSPGDFIPMIEQSGLIRPFTVWVLEEAIIQLKHWCNADIHLTIAVNLSTRNLLDSELLGNLMHLLESHDVSPSQLTLEVTESAVMSRPEVALRVLTQLHEQGLKLSIDDFGTGYSSLAYLKKLPVDELKIDQTFIFGLTTDDDNAVIVRSTIELAQNMGLRVVAEGVEDQETMDMLTSLKCDIAQGYHMGRPAPVDQLEQWLVDSPWGLRKENEQA